TLYVEEWLTIFVYYWADSWGSRQLMADKTKDKNAGRDMDALEVLPLSMIPLSSNTLKNAKLIKNSRLETAVELYNDPIAGSLQIYPQDIADQIAASER